MGKSVLGRGWLVQQGFPVERREIFVSPGSVRTFPQDQDSSPEDDGSSQEDGRTEDGGTAILIYCNGPPLQSGERILDCRTHSLQPPAVMCPDMVAPGWDAG